MTKKANKAHRKRQKYHYNYTRLLLCTALRCCAGTCSLTQWHISGMFVSYVRYSLVACCAPMHECTHTRAATRNAATHPSTHAPSPTRPAFLTACVCVAGGSVTRRAALPVSRGAPAHGCSPLWYCWCDPG
eukprot:scaffold12967_cov120-Isochrysis_galbana.AAC.10